MHCTAHFWAVFPRSVPSKIRPYVTKLTKNIGKLVQQVFFFLFFFVFVLFCLLFWGFMFVCFVLFFENVYKRCFFKIDNPNAVKSYKNYLQNTQHVVLRNCPTLSIGRERLACLNNPHGVQLGTLT